MGKPEQTIGAENRMSDAFDLIKAGLIVYVEDANSDSWAFGIKNVVNHALCICQALGKKNVPLVVNSAGEITIVVPEENGAHSIKATIEESLENNVKLTLRPTGEIEFFQRRRYFRLARPAILIQYQIKTDSNSDQPQLPVECIVWDISGSGAGLVVRSTKPIRAGSLIRLFVTIPDHETIDVTAEVARVVPRSIIRNEFLVGVNFSTIREAHRDKIVRYITEAQLSLHKRKKR